MNEFSLYPNITHGPIESLNHFIAQLEKLANTLPINLHILISSIPVKRKDIIHNMAFHVKCGGIGETCISPFAKAVAHFNDPYYGLENSTHISEPIENEDIAACHLSSRDHKEENISYGFFDQLTTAGKIPYCLTAEICADTDYNVAFKKTAGHFSSAKLHRNAPFPRYFSHTLTSNTINVTDTPICPTITQADPYESHQMNRRYVIQQPAFGSKTVLYVYPIRSLEKSTFDKQINIHNNHFIELQAWRLYRAQHPTDIEYANRQINVCILRQFDLFFDQKIKKQMNLCGLIALRKDIEEKMRTGSHTLTEWQNFFEDKCDFLKRFPLLPHIGNLINEMDTVAHLFKKEAQDSAKLLEMAFADTAEESKEEPFPLRKTI